MLRAAALVLVAGAAACSDETGLVENPDLGPRIQLPLSVGDTFTYRGTLTRREASNLERQAAFRLELEIVGVDDNLDRAPAVVTVLARGESLPAGGDAPWQGFVDDFDSWIARLGPTGPSDGVSSEPTDLTLTDAPRIPPALQPNSSKPLPQLDTFFIDVRRLAAVQQDWLDQDDGRGATFEGDNFLLTASGPAPLGFHDFAQRTLRMVFDPDGVLQELTERLGPTQQQLAQCEPMDDLPQCTSAWTDARLFLEEDT